LHTYEVKIKGETPLLHHKFNGQEEEKKLKKLPDKEQAEAHLYKNAEGKAYVPAIWISQALKNAYIEMAPKGQKTSYARYISARLTVYPLEIILPVQKYVIDKRSAPSQIGKKACRDFCVRPRFDEWDLTFKVRTTLSLREFKKILEFAGTDLGIGSGRKLGFGRFSVVEVKEIQA